MQALDHTAGWLLAAATLRALAERWRGRGGARISTSLAGIAGLLAAAPGETGGDADEFDPASVPSSAAVEQTGWGPARGMVPPFVVTDRRPTTLRFARGAVALGRDEPTWQTGS